MCMQKLYEYLPFVVCNLVALKIVRKREHMLHKTLTANLNFSYRMLGTR